MRIIFMGTPDFAVESLKALVENHCNVVAVITAPDKPAGRGQKLRETPVKVYANLNNIPVLQPPRLKNPEFLEELRSYKADLQIVVAFRMLPEIIWAMPPKGTFNLHGSLLPQYRGAAPINWAIMNGEEQTGVTTFFIEKEIDTGKIMFTDTLDIGENMTAGELHDEMMVAGANLVLKTVRAIEKNEYPVVAQNELINSETELKEAPKIHKETCQINWNKTASEVHNHIRGLSPYPAAWAELMVNSKQQAVKIFESRVAGNKSGITGKIDTDNKTYLSVGTALGSVHILSLQMPGKKRISIEEFLRGYDANSLEVVL